MWCPETAAFPSGIKDSADSILSHQVFPPGLYLHHPQRSQFVAGGAAESKATVGCIGDSWGQFYQLWLVNHLWFFRVCLCVCMHAHTCGGRYYQYGTCHDNFCIRLLQWALHEIACENCPEATVGRTGAEWWMEWSTETTSLHLHWLLNASNDL